MLVNDEYDKLLMIPGPTPVQRDILDAISLPTISHTSAPMAAIVSSCLAGLRHVVQTEDSYAFVFGGSGTLAQEAAVINLVQPGERLLVVSNGYFGDRFVGIASAHGIEVDRLAAPWGQCVTPNQVRERLSAFPARAVTFTHVDTSTGVAAPVQELAAVAKETGAFAIVDSVCALGGMPIPMGAWDIDIVLSGAQKALGVPPGLAILGVSPEAMDRRRSLPRVGAYYADLANWESSMNDPQVYFSTHAVNLFYALQAGFRLVNSEGLDARFERHARLARGFRAGMEALGFVPLTDRRYLAPTLSVLAYPQGVDDDGFRRELAARGIVAAGCLGEFKGRGIRFGHMGNISDVEILQTIAAVEETLVQLGSRIMVGRGMTAARQAMAETLVAG